MPQPQENNPAPTAQPEFPQGTPEPQGAPIEQQAAPTPAPETMPGASNDDPEFWQSLGEQLDKQRNMLASATMKTVGPSVNPPVRYIPYVPPDPSGGWASVFDPKPPVNIPVYAGETDAQATGKRDWEDQQPTGYMLAQTASQATFGASTKWGTGDFERNFEARNPGEVNQLRLAATANNVAGWDFTPAGVVLNKVFGMTFGFLRTKIAQTAVAKALSAEIPESGAFSWAVKNLGTVPPQQGISQIEQAVKTAGGKFLENGSLYLPPGMKGTAQEQAVKDAVNLLRTQLKSKAPVKILRDLSRYPIAQSLATQGSATVGAGAVTGAAAVAGRQVVSGQGNLQDIERGAAIGGAVALPFAIASAIGTAFGARSTSIKSRALTPTTGGGGTGPMWGEEFSQPRIWDVARQGPVPPGYTGKIMFRSGEIREIQ